MAIIIPRYKSLPGCRKANSTKLTCSPKEQHTGRSPVELESMTHTCAHMAMGTMMDSKGLHPKRSQRQNLEVAQHITATIYILYQLKSQLLLCVTCQPKQSHQFVKWPLLVIIFVVFKIRVHLCGPSIFNARKCGTVYKI